MWCNHEKFNLSVIENEMFRNFFIEVCEILFEKDRNLTFRDNGSAFGLSYPNKKSLTYITTTYTFKFYDKSYNLLSENIDLKKILEDVKRFGMSLYNTDDAAKNIPVVS